MSLTTSLLFPIDKLLMKSEGLTGPVQAVEKTIARREDEVDGILSMFGHTGSRQTRHYNRRNGGPGMVSDSVSNEAATAIVIMIVIDIMVLCLAIHYIRKCAQARGWSTMTVVLLIILMFVPSIGPLFMIGIIIYGLFGGCKPKQSFNFY